MVAEDLGVRFASVARQLLEEPDEEQTLDRAVALAVDIVEGCDQAGISIVYQGNRLQTPAATSEAVRHGDEWQYELGEGPCLDSLQQEQTTISRDLARQSRWRRWAPRVVEELGVRSMLCFQLFTDSESLGVLSLYSKEVDAFDDNAQAVGLALAPQIAVALAAARRIETQARGLATRTVIGQAQGILMERYDLTRRSRSRFSDASLKTATSSLLTWPPTWCAVAVYLSNSLTPAAVMHWPRALPETPQS